MRQRNRHKACTVLVLIFMLTFMFMNLKTYMTSPMRRAYAFLSYGSDVRPVLIAATNCRRLAGKSVEVIIARIGQPIPTAQLPDGVTQRQVSKPINKGRYQWVHSFAKFWVSQWYEFDSIIFLDTDILLFQSLDHLFDLVHPAADHLIWAAPAYWISPNFLSSSLFVISPRRGTVADGLFRRVLISDTSSFKQVDSEMDWFNQYLRTECGTLDSIYNMLVGEFYPNDNIYRHFGRKLGITPAEMLKQAPLVHFVADWKPWNPGSRDKFMSSTELKSIFETWTNVMQQIKTGQRKGGRKHRRKI